MLLFCHYADHGCAPSCPGNIEILKLCDEVPALPEGWLELQNWGKQNVWL